MEGWRSDRDLPSTLDVLLKSNAVAARRKAANTADPSKNEIWLAMRHRTRSATATRRLSLAAPQAL
jgi:hypothetical protein